MDEFFYFCNSRHWGNEESCQILTVIELVPDPGTFSLINIQQKLHADPHMHNHEMVPLIYAQ